MEKGFESEGGFLTGKLIIAMPAMSDPRFKRSVICICAHSENGAIGLIINKLVESLSFSKISKQLKLNRNGMNVGYSGGIYFGGPVETGRGFILHSADYSIKGSTVINEQITMTASTQILQALADGEGPKKSIIALGYAGWGPGQLDAELQANAWLSIDSDQELIFSNKIADKWDKAFEKIGVTPALLSSDYGRA
jgi:putative transcriptional regulator